MLIDLDNCRAVLPPCFCDDSLFEARVDHAKYCLQVESGHQSGVDFPVNKWKRNAVKALQAKGKIHWIHRSEDKEPPLCAPEKITEHGAEILAIYLIQELTGFQCVRVSLKGSGRDFELERCTPSGVECATAEVQSAGLEISGTLSKEYRSKRLGEKLNQVSKPNKIKISGLVYVVIIDFETPSALADLREL